MQIANISVNKNPPEDLCNSIRSTSILSTFIAVSTAYSSKLFFPKVSMRLSFELLNCPNVLQQVTIMLVPQNPTARQLPKNPPSIALVTESVTHITTNCLQHNCHEIASASEDSSSHQAPLSSFGIQSALLAPVASSISASSFPSAQSCAFFSTSGL